MDKMARRAMTNAPRYIVPAAHKMAWTTGRRSKSDRNAGEHRPAHAGLSRRNQRVRRVFERARTVHTRLAIVSIVLFGAACATGRFGPAPGTKAPEGTHTLNNLSVDEREATLQRARVWQAIDTRSLDLAVGPPLPSAQRIREDLACTFAFPEKPLTGNTPKFLCEVAPGDVVKVKYGEKNGEVYAEIAASRLFWALGFKADRMYPARVSCRGCPADPFAASKTDWHAGKPGDIGLHVFDPAAVERPLPGSTIEVPGFEGWAWPELDKVSSRAGGSPRAHVDALKLLAVFVQHSDSKPEQQDLLCAPGRVKRDRGGNETCLSPWLVVTDLGATFGKATARNNSKMDFDGLVRRSYLAGRCAVRWRSLQVFDRQPGGPSHWRGGPPVPRQPSVAAG